MKQLINFLSSVFYLPIVLSFICGLLVIKSCDRISAVPRWEKNQEIVRDDFKFLRIGNSTADIYSNSNYQQSVSVNATLRSQMNQWHSEAEEQRLRADANLKQWRSSKELLKAKEAEYKRLYEQHRDTVVLSNQRRLDLETSRTNLKLEKVSHAETQDYLVGVELDIQRLQKDNQRLKKDLEKSRENIYNLKVMMVLFIIIVVILLGTLSYWLHTKSTVDFEFKEVFKRKEAAESIGAI